MANFIYLDPAVEFGYVRFEMANFPILNPSDVGYVHGCCAEFERCPVKICYGFYFFGNCRFGGRCKFLHVYRTTPPAVLKYSPKPDDANLHSDGCLKKLEIEVVQLLEFRGGIPLSITSIQIFYSHRYGWIRNQDQWNDNLCEVLAHSTKFILMSKIYSNYRPHGRESIILVDDINRFNALVDVCAENNLHQVYLTFPPQSMLTDEDFRTYFNYFGDVLNVNIPNQQQRMFGYVTFAYPETATLVLTKTNPHFIRQVEVNAYWPRAALDTH